MIDWMRQSFHRFHSFFRQPQLDQELDAEMASHLELAIEENLQRGMSPEEARRQALIGFGGTEQAKEHHRETRSLPALEVLSQDLRYTLRTLRRDRAFALIAILILALGIGANIAVFSVVNTILLRPLPFRDSQQLTWFAGSHGQGPLSGITYNVGVYEEFRRHNQSFQEVSAFQPFWGSSEYNMTGHGEPQHVQAVMVADNFFRTLGVMPALGRTFLPTECTKGAAPTVLLTQAFWQQEFGADPAIVGQAITLDNKAATVIGVLPSSFDFPSVFWPGLHADIFIPAIMDDIRDWGNTLAIFGRLKPNVSLAQAQAEANVLLPQLKAAHSDWFMEYTADMTSLKEYVSGKLRRSLTVLWCAVGLILLIVCVNLSNLLLARLASRNKEFAVRNALGASRGRLIRQLLTESLVLSCAGALLGVGLAYAVTYYLAHQGSIVLPLLSSVRVDGAALGWTLIITLAVGVLFGIAPGLILSGANVQENLKDAGRGLSEGRKHDVMRSVLVVSEVALSCVLLVGAGLLLRSFLRILDVELGFQPSHTAAITINYDDGNDGVKRGVILQEILRQVKALPGVESAGIVDMLPLDRNRSWGLLNPSRPYPKDEDLGAIVRIVTPGYLDAMGIRLIEGRDFSWQDANKEGVVIINETGARRHWPGESPIGRLARGMGKDPDRVIGVVADVRVSSLETSPGPEMYLLVTEATPEGSELVVRSKLSPDALTSMVMNTLRKLNPAQPATVFRPVQTLVDHAVSPRRFFVMLVSIFAGLGLVLAALGIYGVISYSVTRQTQEIGIRMALGATAGHVLLGILSRTMRLATVGIGLGAITSLAVARWISSLLFHTEPAEPATFLIMILLLLSVACAAGFFPARRASSIDPMVALRND
jgi:putative ABC transport system permease protein